MPGKSKKKNNNNNNNKPLNISIQNDQAKVKDGSVSYSNKREVIQPQSISPQIGPISPSTNSSKELAKEKPLTNEEEKPTSFEDKNEKVNNENKINEEENNEKKELAITETPKSSGYILVFDDPINYNVKHPLKNKWTFWFDKPSNTRSKEWGDHLERIYTFEYIEDFWRLYHNIPPVSKLATQSNYHLFKEGIVPKWEDPMNENGGRWMVHVEKSSKQVDNYFLRAMLACIGEQITTNEDEICGVVASVKPHEDRLSLWCYSTPEESSVTRMCGHQFKKLLEIPQESKLYFQSSKSGMGGHRAVPSQLNYIV